MYVFFVYFIKQSPRIWLAVGLILVRSMNCFLCYHDICVQQSKIWQGTHITLLTYTPYSVMVWLYAYGLLFAFYLLTSINCVCSKLHNRICYQLTHSFKKCGLRRLQYYVCHKFFWTHVPTFLGIYYDVMSPCLLTAVTWGYSHYECKDKCLTNLSYFKIT
jgi:hypothetical protein